MPGTRSPIDDVGFRSSERVPMHAVDCRVDYSEQIPTAFDDWYQVLTESVSLCICKDHFLWMLFVALFGPESPDSSGVGFSLVLGLAAPSGRPSCFRAPAWFLWPYALVSPGAR